MLKNCPGQRAKAVSEKKRSILLIHLCWVRHHLYFRFPSNSSIFHWRKHPVRTDMMYDNVSFHPNLVPLTPSSPLIPSRPLSSFALCSLTKHMPTAFDTCLAKKESEQTTPPTVVWRWFCQTHPAKAIIMVSSRLLEESITQVISQTASIIRLFSWENFCSEMAAQLHTYNIYIQSLQTLHLRHFLRNEMG